jgi:hypothetical protein
MLEPIAVKVARWVPRGGSGSNATSLPDKPTLGAARSRRLMPTFGGFTKAKVDRNEYVL